jgi:hypothetical protein
MKTYTLTVILLLVCFKIFSQIEKPIENPKKISFTYKTTPNIHFEKNALFADTLLFKTLFPNKIYELVNSENTNSKILGKIFKSDLNEREMAVLGEVVYHSFNEEFYTYNVLKNTVKIKGSICKTKDCHDVFKIFFEDQDISGTDFLTREIKYFDAEQMIKTKSYFGNAQMDKKSINYSNNTVTWIDTTNHIGEYTTLKENKTVDNTIRITADQTLNKHITPIDLFANCEFGIISMKSKNATIKLTKVVYE